MYRTIMVGTDGSETAAVAEGVAIRLADSSGGRVLCVSAYANEAGRERASEAAEAARARAEASKVPSEAEVVQAEPADGIVELADRMAADLLVIGDVGMGRRRAVRLGGVPDRVSHQMPCDLLVVRTSKSEGAAPAGEYGRVLLATDGSPTADRAVRVGAGFAGLLGARIALVHVGEETLGSIIVRDAAERLAETDVETHVVSGDAGAAIAELAGSQGYDLVVVGNKGMGGHLRFLAGAVPDTVAHQAPCDVLIVNTVGRSIEDLERGEGAIVEVSGHKVAAFRDQTGALITLSPKCKHMGCTVGWNHRAKTWDCPCHGSRYESDGTVHNGPTRHPLDAFEMPEGS